MEAAVLPPTVAGREPRTAAGGGRGSAVEIAAFFQNRVGVSPESLCRLRDMGVTSWAVVAQLSEAHLGAAGLDDDQVGMFREYGRYITSVAPVRRETEAPPEVMAAIRGTGDLLVIQLGMRSFRHLEKVQVTACRAISNLAAGDRLAKLQAGRMGLLADVQAALQGCTPNNTSLLHAICSALVVLTADSWANQAAAAALGLPHNLTLLLAHNSRRAPLCAEALDCLWHITSSCQEPGHPGVKPAALVPELASAMQTHKTDADIQSSICGILAHLSLGEAGKRAILGMLPELRMVMDVHYHTAAVQQACCTVLGNAVVSEEDEEAAAECGFLLAINDGMDGHPHGAGVQAAACWALSRICATHQPNKDEARKQGLTKRIVSTLREFRRDSAVQKHGFWALVQLTHGNVENQAEIGKLGILRDIKEIMAAREGDVSSEYVLLEQAFWALITNLTFAESLNPQSAQNRALAQRLGLLDVADDAMREAQRDATPEEQGLWAVRQILVGSRREESRDEMRALEEVKAIMSVYPGHAVVQEQCAAAVWSLTAVATPRVKETAANDLVDLLRDAMMVNKSSAGVQVQCCWALSNLTYNCPANRATALNAQFVRAIRSSMAAHKRTPAVVEAGCLALRNVLVGAKEAVPLGVDSKLVSELLSVMRSCGDNPLVQENVCWLLGAVANGNLRAGNEVMGDALGKTLAPLQELMKRARMLPRIQERAAVALHDILLNRTSKDADDGSCRALRLSASKMGIAEQLHTMLRVHRHVTGVQEHGMAALETLTSAVSAMAARAKQLGVKVGVVAALGGSNQRQQGLQQVHANKFLKILNAKKHESLSKFVEESMAGMPSDPKPVVDPAKRPNSAANGAAPVTEALLRRIVTTADLSLLRTAMQGHKKHPMLQELACRRIAELTSSDPSASVAAAAGILLPDILDAMRAHKRVPEVQAQACAALKYIVGDWERSAPADTSFASEREVVRLATAVVIEHRMRPDVVAHAFHAVAAVAGCSAAVQSEAVNAGLLSEVHALCSPDAGSSSSLLEAAFWATHTILTGNSFTSRTAQSMGLLADMARAAEAHAATRTLAGLVSAVKTAVGAELLAGVVGGEAAAVFEGSRIAAVAAASAQEY